MGFHGYGGMGQGQGGGPPMGMAAASAAPLGIAPAGAVMGSHYEFSPDENLRLARVGKRAKWCGLIALVGGAIGTLVGVIILVAFSIGLATSDAATPLYAPAAIGSTVLPTAVVNLVVGYSYVKAGDALTELTTTAGADMPHMMAALGRLRVAFQLETIVGAIALCVGGVVAVISQVMR